MTPEEYAEAARAALDDGYDAIKVDPLEIDRNGDDCVFQNRNRNYSGLLLADQLKMGEARIAAMREAMGDDADIIVEIHSLLGTNSAIQFAKAIEKYRIFLYEEPSHPLNSDNMQKVSRSTTIPIATGERSYTRWGYRNYWRNSLLP